MSFYGHQNIFQCDALASVQEPFYRWNDGRRLGKSQVNVAAPHLSCLAGWGCHSWEKTWRTFLSAGQRVLVHCFSSHSDTRWGESEALHKGEAFYYLSPSLFSTQFPHGLYSLFLFRCIWHLQCKPWVRWGVALDRLRWEESTVCDPWALVWECAWHFPPVSWEALLIPILICGWFLFLERVGSWIQLSEALSWLGTNKMLTSRVLLP